MRAIPGVRPDTPSMTPEALETFLARAMTAAAGLGMTAVRAEEDEDA